MEDTEDVVDQSVEVIESTVEKLDQMSKELLKLIDNF